MFDALITQQRRQRLDALPRYERAEVDAASKALSACGAYHGSEADAVTDATAIVRAARNSRPRRWKRLL